jgi:hypothetical protein
MRDGPGDSFHSPFRARPELSVSCARCGVLHATDRALDYRAVCESCAGDGDADDTPHFHPLDAATITDVVNRVTPGNYTLGYRVGSSFAGLYIGRSDSDVGARLLDWVGTPSVPERRRPSSPTPWSPRANALRGPANARSSPALGADTPYTHFAFSYAASALAAFERQCRAYHDLGGADALDNRHHPRPPADCVWRCPVHA